MKLQGFYRIGSWLVLLVLLPCLLYGQSNLWQSLNGPPGGSVYQIAIDQNNILYAAGPGGIFRSGDKWNSWKRINYYDWDLKFCLTKTGAIYVPFNQNIGFSQDHGDTWTVIPGPLGRSIRSFVVDNDGTIYVSDVDTVYAMKSQGATWTPLPTRLNSWVGLLKIDDQGRIFLTTGTRLYVSTDEGASWQLIYSRFEDGVGDIRDVFVTDQKTYITSIGSKYSVVYESADWANWKIAKMPAVSSLYLSPQGWLLGASAKPTLTSPDTSFICFAVNQGYVPILAGFWTYSFAVSSTGDIFAATSQGIYLSSDGGSHWDCLSPMSAEVIDIETDSAGRLFVVAQAYDHPVPYRFWSFDGLKWSELDWNHAFGAYDFRDFRILDDDTFIILVGQISDGSVTRKDLLLVSHDFGQTWQLKKEHDIVAPYHEHLQIDYDSSRHILFTFIARESQFSESKDNGDTWNSVATPFAIRSFSSLGLASCWATTGDEHYISINNGRKWAWMGRIELSRSGRLVALNGMGSIFLLDYNPSFFDMYDYPLQNIERSDNWGVDWIDIMPSSEAAKADVDSPPSIQISREGTIYVYSPDYLCMSKDHGSSWIEMLDNPSGISGPLTITAMHQSRDGEIYIGTQNDGMIKCNNKPDSFSPRRIGALNTSPKMTYAVCWIDYDNDGHEDLFFANQGPNELYRNKGDGTFTKITIGAIVTDDEPSRAATWGDYDNDGNADLFVANEGATNSLYHNNGDGSFSKITGGILVSTINTSRGCAWGDYDSDGWLDLVVVNRNEKNLLYRNLGDGSFQPIITGAFGSDTGESFGCSWCDYDLDGDLDLFIANKGENFLYRQMSKGDFQKVLAEAFAPDALYSFGGSWGDYDADGYPDLFVANADGPNALYHNKGDGSFAKTDLSGITTDEGVSKGSGWTDFNNNGYLDLFVANNGSKFFYRNNGDGTFTSGPANDFVFYPSNSLSLAWGDANDDGAQDLLVTSFDKQTVLYENTGAANHWLKVKCIGTLSNKSGIGARVSIRTSLNGQLKWQTREITSQSGFAGQSSLVAHFGLGDAGIIDSLRVNWPSGQVQVMTALPANEQITLIEQGGTLVENLQASAVIPLVYKLEQNYPNPFNPGTTIEFSLPRPENVHMRVLSILGEQIEELAQGFMQAGTHKVIWNAEKYSNGLYFIQFEAGSYREVRKAVLMK